MNWASERWKRNLCKFIVAGLKLLLARVPTIPCCCCVHSVFNEIHFWRCALSCDNFCDAMRCDVAHFGWSQCSKWFMWRMTFKIACGILVWLGVGAMAIMIATWNSLFFLSFQNTNQTQYKHICIFYMYQFIYALLSNMLRTMPIRCIHIQCKWVWEQATRD